MQAHFLQQVHNTKIPFNLLNYYRLEKHNATW